MRSEMEPDVNKLKFMQLLDRGERAQKKEFGLAEALLLEPHIRKIGRLTMSQETERPHRYDEVNQLIIALLLEHDLFKNGQTTELGILRQAVFGGAKDSKVYLIDGLRRHLPNFPEIRTISLDDKNLVIPLSFYMDFKKVKNHLEQAGFAVEKGRDGHENEVLNATSPNGGKFTIGRMKIMFDHSICETMPQKFEEGLTRFVEFACLLPFERKNWAIGSNTVYLNELRPIMDMMFDIKKEVLGDIFRNLFGIVKDGEAALSGSGYFRETKKSEVLREKGIRGEDEKSYGLDKAYLPDHINYIVVKQNKDRPASIIIEIDCHLNMREMENELRKIEGQKLFITTPKEKKSMTKKFVNKGNNLQIRNTFLRLSEALVIDEERRVVATLRTPGTMFITVNEATQESVIKLLDAIYDKRLFYTPKIRDAEMGDSKLTDIEREVANAFDSLVEIYRYFLEVEHQRRAWEVAKENNAKFMQIFSPREWIVRKMEESERKDFSGRVLNVLRAMDADIGPSTFSKFGNDPETVKHVNELYATLQNLKGRFEAICEVARLETNA